MKVQHLSLGFSWPAPEQQALPSSPSSSSSLSSSSSSSTTTTKHPKRLRPLAPKLSISAAEATSPEFMTAKFASTRNPDSSLMQSGGSGTRWNPMPEQIKVLEALYQGGMRTPNPAQIERITAELGRYGRIEGKNVFYWFQNHKARERQKQKRSAALLALAANNSPLSNNLKVQLQKEETKTTMTTTTKKKKKKKELEWEDGSGCCKRKCRSWGSAGDESGGATDRTLELFPLRPEWKQMG